MPGLKPDPAICGECFRAGFIGFLKRSGISECGLDGYIGEILTLLEEGVPPPLAGAGAWRKLRETSGIVDLFADEKRFFTESLLNRLDVLKERFRHTPDPVSSALAAATWCNLIDSAQGNDIPDPDTLLGILGAPLSIDHRQAFLTAMGTAESLLILGDNAGETVMDRLFLELAGFGGRVYYMVRPLPVMNDATGEDARMAGLHRFAEIIHSGSDVPSVIPELLSPDSARIFHECDLILSKGQGNLEGLWGLGDERIFHAFVVKCPVVAEATALPRGSGVFVSSMKLEG